MTTFMHRRNTIYEAFEQDLLNTLSNMDPDDLLDLLQIDTLLLLDILSPQVEDYIKEKYREELEDVKE